MVALEVFAHNGTAVVSTGGNTTPSPGTTETWTVAGGSTLPAAATGVTQFHVGDPALPGELILVTNVSGVTLSVTRGADSTTTAAHGSNFTIRQVLPASWLTFVQTSVFGIVAAVSVLTDVAVIAVNAALGNHFRVTLAGNRQLQNPTNPVDGQKITFEVIQDGTGNRTLSYDTAYDFGIAGAPILTTTAAARDLIGFVYSSSKAAWLFSGITKGL
jgi:hypothetical protein